MLRKVRNISYVLVDAKSGLVRQRFKVPQRLFPPTDIAEGFRVVAPKDGNIPGGEIRLDMRKIRKSINLVGSIETVAAPTWKPARVSEHTRSVFHKKEQFDRLDKIYAARLAETAGPLAYLHAEKRRQAEVGGGPLVADEADRLAILANAKAQDERLAAIERERRAIKAALKAATTEDEIKAALVTTRDDEKSSAHLGLEEGRVGR